MPDGLRGSAFFAMSDRLYVPVYLPERGADDWFPVWERLPTEPAVWFSRFSRYLGMGPTRTMSGAYQSERADAGQPKTKGLPRSWSLNARKYRWRDRAAEFDYNDVVLANEERRKTIEAAQKRQQRFGRLMQGKAAKKIDELKLSEFGADTAVRMMVEGVRIELNALQVPVEVVEARVQVAGTPTFDPNLLSVEDLLKLREMHEKMSSAALPAVAPAAGAGDGR